MAGGTALKSITLLITGPIMVRRIGFENYGHWVIASSIIAALGLIDAGVSTALSVLVAEIYATKDWERLGRVIGTIVLVGAPVLLAAGCLPVVALVTYSTYAGIPLFPGAQLTYLLLGLTLICRLLQQLLNAWLQASGAYGCYSMVLNLQPILLSLAAIAATFIHEAIAIVALSQLLVTVAFLALQFAVGRGMLRNIQLRPAFDQAELRVLISKGGPTWLGQLGSTLFTQCDKLVISSILSPALLSIYAIVTTATSQLNVLCAMAVQPLIPGLAQAKADGLESRGRSLEATALLINIILAIIGTAGLLGALPWLLPLIPGASTSHIPMRAVQSVVIIYGLYSMNCAAYFILLTRGQIWFTAKTMLSAATISLALIFVGARHFGLAGAFCGNVGFLVIFVLTGRCFRNTLGAFRETSQAILPSMAIFILISALLYCTNISRIAGSLAALVSIAIVASLGVRALILTSQTWDAQN